MIQKRVLWLIGTIILGVGLVSPAMAQQGRIVFNNGNDGNIYMVNADGFNLIPLTSGPAVSSRDQMPYLSSDHRVVYSSKLIGNNYEIWIMNDDGSDTTKLTSFWGADEYPMLSPDGTKIVFQHQGAKDYDIWMMDDNGANLIQLTNNPADDKNPCFSVDGSKIIFTSDRTDTEEIYIMNIDGSNQVNLTNNPGAKDYYARFSPDGTKITFTSERNGNQEVYIMDADGSNQTRLTNHTAWDGYSSFSPDGTRLAFLSLRGGGANIWTMYIDGSNLSHITVGPKDWNPCFGAPDPPGAPTNFTGSAVSSSRIDLSWTDNDNNEVGFKLERKTGLNGVFMNLALLGPNITSYQDSGLAPNTTYYYKLRAYNAGGVSDTSEVNFTTLTSPSPGLGHILFSDDVAGNREIFIMSADGTRIERLTNFPGLDDMPFLSLDGRRIAFVSARTGNNDIWVMNVDGTDTLRLTTSPGDDRYPAISPDGSKIVFQSRRDGNREIYIMNSNGSNQTNLTNNPAADQNPRFSPDGTKVIFHSNRKGNNDDIYVMGVDGQGVMALTDNIDYNDWYPSFSPQGDRITYTSNRDGNFAIYIANFDGSNPVRLTNPGTDYFYSSFSPDGAKLSLMSDRWALFTINSDGTGLVTIRLGSNWNPVYGALRSEDTVPSAPTTLAAQAVSSSQINLTWTDNANNENGFKIERKTGVGGIYTQIATVIANVITYQNTGLDSQTTYYYRVRAYNAAGDSGYSNEAYATIPAGAGVPNPPSNLIAAAVSVSQIDLSWTDNSDTEDGFKIERKTGVGGTYTQIATVIANVITYQNTGLDSQTTYYYRVRAYNAAGNSGYSNEANATTQGPAIPNAPTNLAAAAVSSSQINLSWTDNANNENGFKIERKTGFGGTYDTAAIVGPNVASYSDTGLSASTTYYYQVKAYNAAGDSDYSNETNATTSAGLEAGKIAFVSDRNGNAEIYAMSIDGQNQSNLTNNPSQDKAPAISPDGYRIAFASNRFNVQYEIYTMSADGLNPSRLTNNSADDNNPVFSSDGNKIAFESARDGNYEIYIMDANGSNQTKLTNNPYWDQHPTFSPDGTKIAFVSMRDGDYEIWIMNVNGSNPTKLTDNTATDYYPSFGPDERIVFVSTRNGNEEIYVMNSDGTSQTRLTNNPAIDRYPCFSPDGSRITFATDRDGGGKRIYVMDADGSNPAPLTLHPSDNYDPYWGPGQAPDTTPPTAFDLLSPPDGSQVDTTSPLLVWGSSSDPESGLAGYDLYIDGAWNKSVDASITSTTPASPLSGVQHAWYVNARNKAGLTTRSTSVWSFNTDGTPPVTSVILSTPSYNNYYLTSSTTITLSPVDTGSGVASTRYRINDEGWLTYTVQFTLAGRIEGEHTIQYYSTDNAGNVEQTKSLIVYMDNISPVTTITAGVPNKVMGSVTYVTLNTGFTLSAVDAAAGVASTRYRIDAGSWTSYAGSFSLTTSETHTIYYQSTDHLGNTEDTKSLVVYLDKTPPQTSLNISGPQYGSYVTSATQFSLAATDTGAGVASTRYRIDAGSWTSYAGSFSLTTSETHTIYYQSTDHLGNTEDTKSLAVYLDQTTPVTNLGISQPKYIVGAKIYVKASTSFIMSVTESGSGFDSTSYRIDSGKWKSCTASFSLQSEEIGTEGEHTLQYYSTDHLGNTENTKSLNIYLDQTGPTTQLVPSGPNYQVGNTLYITSATSFSLTAEDPGSGVASLLYRINAGSWTPYAGSFSLTTSETHTIYYQSIDRLSNYEGIKSLAVYLDETPPQTAINISGPQYGSYITSATQFSLEATDAGVGADTIQYRIDGITGWTKYQAAFTLSIWPADGSCTISYRSMDYLGNTEAANSQAVYLDNTPPATTDDAPVGWNNTPVTINLSPADTGSGVATTRYSTDGISWNTGTQVSLTASGIYTLRYYSTDRLGHQEQTHQTKVNLDLTPPNEFALLSPANGDWTDSPSPVFRWSSTTNGESGMAGYDLYLDGVLNKSVDAQTTSTQLKGTMSEGTHTWYVVARNNAGDTIASNSVFKINLDITPPATTDNAPSGWNKTPVTINLSPTDTGSGVATTHYSTDGISWKTGTQVSLTASGIYTLRYYSTDRLGNQEQTHQTEVKIDLTPPNEFALLSPANGDWTDSPSPVFTWSPTTNGESGMAGYDLYLDGRLNKSVTAQITSTQLDGTMTEGSHTWYVVARNNAGDTIASNSTFSFGLDFTSPTTGLTISDTKIVVGQVTYVTSTNTFSLSAVDTGSGVKSIRYRIDGGSWNTYQTPFSVETAGAHTIGYQSEDTVGHLEAEKTLNIYVDDVPPTIGLSITRPQYSPNGVKYVDSTTSFSLSDTDGTGVGVKLTEYRLDGAGTWTTYTGSFTLAGKTEDTHTLEYRSADKLGNQTGIKSMTIYLDNTPPTTTDNAPVDWSDTELVVTLSPGDTGSGVAETYYTTDGTEPDTSSIKGTKILLVNEGEYILKYFSVDNLGHQEAIKRAEVRIDLTLPLAFTLLTPARDTWTNNPSPVFTWQATTNGESGIAGYDLYLNGVLNKSVGSGDTSAQLAAGTTLDEGPNTWHVVARNNAGSDRRSTAVFGINLDTTKPGAIDWVNDGSGADIATTGSDSELSANWAAANDGEGSGIAAYFYAIRITQDGTEVVGWTDNGADTSVTRSGLSLSSGKTYYFSVKARDVVGLESDPVYSNGVKLDSTPPLPFDILTPADGAWINSPSPVFTWKAATDAESGIAGYELYLNEALNKSVGPEVTSTQPAGTMTEGAHTWQVKAKNKIGLVTKSTSTYIVRIDITLPTAELNPLPATSEPVFTVSWAGIDTGSRIASYDLEYRDVTAWPAGRWDSLVSNTTDTSHQFNRDDFSHEYSFRVKARDNAGNLGNWSGVKSTKIELDPTPPASFDLLTPASGTWTSDTQPQLSWQSSSDPESGIDGYSVFIDNQQKVTGIKVTQAAPPQALTAGSHTWYVQAENKAGGLTKSNSTYTINIDTRPPTVSLTALPANSRATFMLSWAGTDDRSGIASYRLEYKKGTDSWQTLVSTTTDTSYEFTGEFSYTYSFKVRATDLAGNIGYSVQRSTKIIIIGSAQWITASLGGTILVNGGGVVTVPANALDTDTYVQVDLVDTPTPMIYYDKIKEVDNPGLKIALLDKGAFIGDITVIIPYQEGKVTNEANLRMYHYNESAKAWELVSGSVPNTGNNTVTATTTDTGEFRLVEYTVDPESLGAISEVSNYPNPFLPSQGTNIVYHLKKDTKVTIRLYDLLGHLVKEFEFSAGEKGGKEGLNHVSWYGRNGEDILVEAGVYLCYIEAGGDNVVRKIMVR